MSASGSASGSVVGVASRTGLAAGALASGLMLIALAGHYPMGAPAIAVGIATYIVVLLLVPHAWLFAFPALLPITGLAPWTGWLFVEEFDALVLATLTIGYLQLARSSELRPTGAAPVSLARWPLLGVAFLAASYVVGAVRGFMPPGALVESWLWSYDSPLNSLRILKGLAAALLLWPLLGAAVRVRGERALALFAAGIACGFSLTGLLAVWERVAFTGLLNFAAEYRVTALFWEMHTGGAAIDGFLVLALPFALSLISSARRTGTLIAGTIATALGGYAILATFTRATYAAAVAALLTLGGSRGAQRPRSPAEPRPFAWRAMRIAVLGVLAALLVAVFLSSGYRGLAAAFGAFGWTLAAAVLLRGASRGEVAAGIVWGTVLVLASVALAYTLPKGAYVAYAASFLTATWLVLSMLRGGSPPNRTVLTATGIWLAGSAVVVAVTWAGSVALGPAVAAALAALAIGFWASQRAVAPWALDRHTMGQAVIGATVITAIAIGYHSQYLGARLAEAPQDLVGRTAHWRSSLSLLDGPADWLLGKGLGQFPSAYFWRAPGSHVPGSHAFADDAGNPHLVLSGPRNPSGYGEDYRFSQRVQARPGEPLVVLLRARAEGPVALALEVCHKHLLYRQACAGAVIQVGTASREWQTFRVPLAGTVGASDWYAPALQFFSIVNDTQGRAADIDDVALLGGDGRDLLANGNFSAGMNRWFFVSDHHHLPWHIKNLWLNYLFDQGWLGVLAFSLVYFGALGRLLFGAARRHPLAPCLAASLVGFGVAGLFDSLVDVPRLATLFFLVVLLGLGLQPPASDRAA